MRKPHPRPYGPLNLPDAEADEIRPMLAEPARAQLVRNIVLARYGDLSWGNAAVTISHDGHIWLGNDSGHWLSEAALVNVATALREIDVLNQAVEVSGLSSREFAEAVLDVDERTLRRWREGVREMPGSAIQLCRAVIADPSVVGTISLHKSA